MHNHNTTYNGLPLPEKGDAKTFCERLSNYISLFDETWKFKIQAISKSQLQTFEDYFDLRNYTSKLPDTYYSFLRTMGGNDGGLITDTIDGYSEISLDVLMKAYDKSMAPYVPFVEVPISGFALFFDLSANCEIVEIFRPDRIYGHSKEPFEKLIFRCAFQKFFLQEGGEKLRQLYPEYISKSFQVKTKQHKSNLPLDNNAYNAILKNLQEKFAISEEWFSNQDGLLTDCFVGTTCGRDTVVTINRQQNYLTVSGYNPQLIDKLAGLIECICVE